MFTTQRVSRSAAVTQSSQPRILVIKISQRLVAICISTLCLALLVIWYVKEPPSLVSTPPRRVRVQDISKKKDAETRDLHEAQQVFHAPEEPALTNPLDTFSCMGDDLPRLEGPYTRPFRFHVYQDMPTHLLADVMEKSAHWWKRDRSENQFTTEIDLFKHLPKHPCHTSDPSKADAFFVPAQTVSAVWLSRSVGSNGKQIPTDEGARYMKEVIAWLKAGRWGRRFDLRDHYVVSIPWWKEGRPYAHNINLIGSEVPIHFSDHETFWDTMYLRASNDIVVPYPDPDSVTFYTEERLANSTRDLFAVFVGQDRVVAPIRAKVLEQLRNYSLRENKPRGDVFWYNLQNRDAIAAVKHQLPRAIFGPVMPGDSYSSRRLFSLLFAGTIPVIICDFCMLPYQDILDYSKFAIFLPEANVLDTEFNVFDYLSTVTDQEVARLQRYGRMVRRHFVFSEEGPVPGDAYDMLVREMALTHYRNRGLKSMMLRSYGEDWANGEPMPATMGSLGGFPGDHHSKLRQTPSLGTSVKKIDSKWPR